MKDEMRNQLIKAIHWLERSTGKRMAGLIFEYAFFKHNLNAIAEKRCSGWFFTRGTNDNERHWFKITTDSNYCWAEPERKLIEQLDEAHKFFLIRAEVVLENGSIQLRPVIRITLHQETKHRLEQTELSKAYEQDIQANLVIFGPSCVDEWLETEYSKFKPKLNYDYTKYLEALEETDLNDLFVSRSLLNLCFSSPVDIDGIAQLTSGEISILEFKRKNPAEGYWKSDNGNHSAIASDIDDIVAPLGKNRNVCKYHFNTQKHNLQLHHNQCKCYGLDLSHYRTVNLCKNKGLLYTYIVWDWTGTREKDTPPLQDLDKNIEISVLKPIDPIIKHCELSKREPDGISTTSGSDSGAYTSGMRIQVMFERERFCGQDAISHSSNDTAQSTSPLAGASSKSATNRVYLNVPFKEKDEAKFLGAAWDAVAKKWYIENVTDPKKFTKWLK